MVTKIGGDFQKICNRQWTYPTKLQFQYTKVILLLISQSGKSEEIFSALITPGCPQIAQSSDHQVEYLVVSDYDEEMDFDGEAHLDNRKGENCPTDNAQKISQNSIKISLNSSQDLKTTLSEHIHAGTVSNQLSATSRVFGEPQQLLPP